MLLAISAPALADTLADCTQSRSLELKIKACTGVIKDKAFGPKEAALAFRHRAGARAEAGAFEDALNDYAQAVKLNPADPAALAGRGQARLARGDVDGALADYNEALKMVPNSVPYFIARGHARLVKGMSDLAVADFSEAIRLNHKSASAFNDRGLAYRKLGKLDEAVADYTQAIMLNPIYALAYNNRAYVYEALGRSREAMVDYGRALVLDPSLIGAAKAQRRLGGKAGFVDESDRLVREGRALVEAACSRCHATGVTGASPNSKAPEFRILQHRHPVMALREPLSRGIAAQHDEMPKFAFKDAEIDAIVAYINSMPTTTKR
ncbi:MAG: tetratricopeptide repeat protein [Hyphomicrobiaceae bacterium]